jgi:hypothetical protein
MSTVPKPRPESLDRRAEQASFVVSKPENPYQQAEIAQSPMAATDTSVTTSSSSRLGVVNAADSGVYVLSDVFLESEMKKVDQLVNERLLDLIETYSSALANTLTDNTVEVDIQLGLRDITNTEDGRSQRSLVPNRKGLAKEKLGIEGIKKNLGTLITELCVESFEVDGRTISEESLLGSWTWIYDLLFRNLEISDDQEGLTEAQLKQIEELLNDPVFQLQNATLLRTILRFYAMTDQKSKQDYEIKAMIGDDEVRIDIPQIERSTAFGTALRTIIRKEDKKGNEGKNKLFSELRTHNPAIIIHSSLGEEFVTVTFKDYCEAYIKISHLRSRLDIGQATEEYVEYLADAAISQSTQGCHLSENETHSNERFEQISEIINSSFDPVVRATRDFLVRKNLDIRQVA